jgi:FkbM family methyltransferase
VQFYSQVGQDRFIFDSFFRGKRNGVFVDVGAYDGEKFNNTLFFEKFMGWRGLCIEPLDPAFCKLAATRKAICEQCCVSNFKGEADFVEIDAGVDEKMLSGLAAGFDARVIERLNEVSSQRVTRKVPVTTLSSLLEKHSLFHIDYCSVDIEGSEMSVLAELDLDRFEISVFTIENNYNDPELPELMADKGYDFVCRLAQDNVFRRRDVKRLARTSILCSVWHGDPQRADLLQGHSASLARQTVPVEPIYVFDNGDRPPEWLRDRTVSVREPLTIYQTWNVALSLVGTPFVMNLNLDDRLHRNAVELLENALLREEATVVGGDWKICYSQAETDNADQECYPANKLPFVPEWPPTPGTVTRLGSGTGQCGTFGPATMWRTEAHLAIPRYPWRFADGTLIKSIGDSIWWGILENYAKKKLLRLPMVIGNYHSHPATQAEFRPLQHDEWSLMHLSGGLTII